MAENEPPGNNILAKAKDALPKITVTDWKREAATTTPKDKDGDGQDEPLSEEAKDMLHQIEHYFTEENLPHDAHMLGLFQDGNGTVSFNEICSFKKMREWKKQKPWIKDVLKRSSLIELVGDGAHPRLRRKVPLQTTPTVTPKVNHDKPAKAAPADKPWLTKGMMKPTGFEEGAEDGEDQEQDNYPSDEAFTSRIQTAIANFTAKRKMHQDVNQVFTKFLIFGGFRGGQAQFVGGPDDKTEDGEKLNKPQYFSISNQVLDGLEAKEGKPTWSVDFESVVKAFFSSQFITFFAWTDKELVKTATNVLRNFHRYLLTHKVCPEYEDQVKAAIKACDLAEEELPKLYEVDRRLPGGFNVACSMLFDGHHSDQLAQGDWAQGMDGGSWNRDQAWMVFRTNVFAYGTKEQVQEVALMETDNTPFGRITELKVGLEIVAIEMPSDSAKSLYARAKEGDKAGIIQPMGKIRCREWKVPHAAPTDLPKHIRDARRNPDPDRQYEFLVEASTLDFCFLGCKLDVTIKQFKTGIKWIDYHQATYASFFTWLANEKIFDWKEPGPPKDWMVRQNEKKNGAGMELERYMGDGLSDDDDELD